MRWLPFSTVAALGISISGPGCAERRPTEPAAPIEGSVPSAVAPTSGPIVSAGTASASALPRDLEASAASVPPSPAPSAVAIVAPDEATTLASQEAPLTGPDGKTLPQTEDRPSVDSPAFKRRLEHLVQAIATDDPSLCLTSFFPLLAYRQVKAVEKPERDYQYRLLRHFERDIHEYHKALGPDAGSAKFEGLDVPEATARWMKPGSEGNRLGYFRVLRSRLRFVKANGKPQTFELTSMISWRGEWYVVHLHGFE